MRLIGCGLRVMALRSIALCDACGLLSTRRYGLEFCSADTDISVILLLAEHDATMGISLMPVVSSSENGVGWPAN
jgi:hypothetical protein